MVNSGFVFIVAPKSLNLEALSIVETEETLWNLMKAIINIYYLRDIYISL